MRGSVARVDAGVRFARLAQACEGRRRECQRVVKVPAHVTRPYAARRSPPRPSASCCPRPPPAATTDYASTALNIIPSGQPGAFPVPTGADRQARMYDALTPLFDKVTSDDLHRDFKSERFGTERAVPVPRGEGPAQRRARSCATATTSRTSPPRRDDGAHVGRRLGHRRGPRAPARAGALQLPRSRRSTRRT